MDQKTASPGVVLSWTFFDFANTAYYTIIITLIYQTYFIENIAGGEKAYWGYTISASMLLTALLGPLFGAIADASNRKKFFLGLFTVACVGATTGLFVIDNSMLWVAIVLVIIANMGFEGGTIFYDAFLPDIAAPKDYARISGYGFAMGYAGAFVVLGAVLFMLGTPPTDAQIRSTFLLAAGMFALFALPVFAVVKEHRRGDSQTGVSLVREGYARLIQTIKHIREYRDVRRFLLAFFVYNDSILTVILFAASFAKDTLHFTDQQRIFFFMLVQGTALIGSVLFGFITNRFGARRIVVVTLLIWVVVVVGAFFTKDQMTFWILGGLAGTALGSAQSTSRALMALLTPPDKRTEFFGFYDGFFGKASAVIGPAVFGQLSTWFGNDRPGMLFIGAMLALGIVLVLRVPDVRGDRVVSRES